MDFPGFEQKFLNTESGRVSYLHRGGKRGKMVFLHGIGGSLKTWNKLVPYLPTGPEVYMLDLLGHGKSDAPDVEYDVLLQVRMLREFTELLAIDKPILFGHSYGGWMAVHYSIDNPAGGLIIEDSAGIESQQIEIRNAGKTDEDRRLLISESVKIGANERVMESAIGNFDKHLLDAEIMSRVFVKTSLIWGDNDEFVPLRFGKEMNNSIKGSSLLVIPGAGHVPHRTKPEIVGKATSDFIAML